MLLALLFMTTWVSPTGFEGVWQSQDPENVLYISIGSEGDVALYDGSWYPYQLMKAQVDESHVHVEAVPEGTVMNFILDCQVREGALEGVQRYPHPQYPMEVPFKATRISRKAIRFPLETVSQHLKEGAIDVVGYILSNAPRDDFEHFYDFWQGRVEPQFLPFLNPLLPALANGSEEDSPARKQALLRLFENLKGLAEAQASVVPLAGQHSDDTLHVLAPCLESGKCSPVSVEVPHSKIAYPKGHRLCCGDRIYSTRTFTVQPLEFKPTERSQ